MGSGNQDSALVSRSGNPGYDGGKPLIAGVVDETGGLSLSMTPFHVPKPGT